MDDEKKKPALPWAGMDNFRFDMTSRGRERFDEAMAIVMRERIEGGTLGVTSYCVHPTLGLVLFAHSTPVGAHRLLTDADETAERRRDIVARYVMANDNHGVAEQARAGLDGMLAGVVSHGAPILPLPYPMRTTAATAFAWNWIVDAADYPKPPGIDGDCKKGWRVHTGNHWGHIGGNRDAVVSIVPTWALLGK